MSATEAKLAATQPDESGVKSVPDGDKLIEMYRSMVLGRALETRLHNMYRSGRLGGAVYPGVE